MLHYGCAVGVVSSIDYDGKEACVVGATDQEIFHEMSDSRSPASDIRLVRERPKPTAGRNLWACLFELLPSVFSERELTLYAIARPPVVCLSAVCNVCAPYSGGSNFRQYFYGIRYLGHPLTSTENFTEIVPEKPIRRGS